ncbi:penicillin-binding protein 4 [Clostridia bacterium]|nr:penicillin-binding protein 4 [Clostridia bacterium]
MAKKKARKKKKFRFFWFLLKLQLFFILLIAGAVAAYYLSGYGAKVAHLQEEAEKLAASATEDTFRASLTGLIYAADGQLISSLKGEKDVYYLDYEDIPAYAKAALVSIEDKKFFKHGGFDIEAIARAAFSFVRHREITQGGSTITQQLARMVFLNQEKTWERKVEEIFLSVALEKKFSKEKILEFYLNNIYFANGYYGIGAASKGYFNQEVHKLDLSQIAFLCAIPNNPSLYDPVVHKDNTLKRRDRILRQMNADGKISSSTCAMAVSEYINLERPEKKKNDYVETYTYYCAARALMSKEGFVFQTNFATEGEQKAYNAAYNGAYSRCQKKLYQDGYRIYTSIDLTMQQKLQDAVDGHLAEYQETNEEGIYTLQGAAVCIDNQNGMVKAIVGGRKQEREGYTLNRAYQSFRQPGSTIKPLLVYAPLLERGYTPETAVLDEPIEGGPNNSGGGYSGRVNIRTAVEKSINTVAWNLLKELTPQVGLSYLKEMNFAKLQEEDEESLDIALGGFRIGTSPIEMASAYAALENDGKFRTPTCIVKILDADGKFIYAPDLKEKQVYQVNAAHMMTDLLEGVLVRGSGKGLALSDMSSAGKTGTTNSNKDGWFVGYTPYYTTSVWVGYDMPKELPGLWGATYPGTIWRDFMEKIHEGMENEPFLPYIKNVPTSQGEDTEGEGTEGESDGEKPNGEAEGRKSTGDEGVSPPAPTEEGASAGNGEEAETGGEPTGTGEEPGGGE